MPYCSKITFTQPGPGCRFIPDNLQAGAFTSFGVPFVDAALALLSVQSITRLYGDVELVDGVDPALADPATAVVEFTEPAALQPVPPGTVVTIFLRDV